MNLVYNTTKSCGNDDKILNSRTTEIPLPTPFSVILSPIHIRNALPAVIVTTTTTTLFIPKLLIKPCLPKPIAIAIDSINAKATVTYLVYSIIFLRPSSPSFCISSSLGIAIVISCIIIELVM